MPMTLTLAVMASLKLNAVFCQSEAQAVADLERGA